MDFSLQGRTVAVVGGNGRLGRAVIKTCAGLKARTICLDATKPTGPEGADVVSFDLTAIDRIESRAEELEARLGLIDCWINCAYPRTADWGRAELGETEDDVAVASWRQNLDQNLTASCVWSTAIAKRMAARKSGSLIFVSSIYGTLAADPWLYESTSMGTPQAYAVIKAGLIAHARTLAAKFAPHVRSNVVCPGGIRADQPQVFLDRYARKTPAGRMAEPEEIAAPIAFLASDAASYITGAVLMVDGGFSVI